MGRWMPPGSWRIGDPLPSNPTEQPFFLMELDEIDKQRIGSTNCLEKEELWKDRLEEYRAQGNDISKLRKKYAATFESTQLRDWVLHEAQDCTVLRYATEYFDNLEKKRK